MLVDDEPLIIEQLKAWLGESGWLSVSARTFDDGLALAEKTRPSLALIDYRLGASHSGIRLGEMILARRGIPFVLISGFNSTSVVVDAMRAGAVDVLDKPLSRSRIDNVLVQASLSSRNSMTMSDQHVAITAVQYPSIGARWSALILAACNSEVDPKTVSLWARSAHVSTSTIEETCRLCDVTTHDSRDLARFIRAIARNWKVDRYLRCYFAVADARTLARLFSRAGLALDIVHPDLRQFLLRQSFAPATRPCVQELGHLAGNSPWFM